jgi:lipopolysaccharide transport system ATP-binding protein
LVLLPAGRRFEGNVVGSCRDVGVLPDGSNGSGAVRLGEVVCMDTIIRVENLSKQYRIGTRQPYRRLTESLTDLVKAPFSALTRKSSRGGSVQDKSESNHFWALKDVSFEVNRGEVVGLIGRNGAGKSTLLKILSRITEPTSGQAWLYGRVGSLLEVGTGFHPELTGRENIFLNGAILGMKRWEILRKFDEIVEFSEVGKFIDSPVKHYSSGMYMRLAFAVAAHLEPEILLVDEVLAVGDAEFQKKCLGKMNEVARHGRTILFVSHNMLAVEAMCSKAMIIAGGKTAGLTPVREAIAQFGRVAAVEGGQVQWTTPESAPGDHQVRLHAVRILSDDQVTGEPVVDRPIRIQIDYWNLMLNSRRLVSIHLLNAMQQKILTSANQKASCLTPDPWIDMKYPLGLFRTTCEIPPNLLNPGRHSIDLYINGVGAHDSIILKTGIITFEVAESARFRTEYFGEWIGAVRPVLHWETTQLE